MFMTPTWKLLLHICRSLSYVRQGVSPTTLVYQSKSLPIQAILSASTSCIHSGFQTQKNKERKVTMTKPQARIK